MLGANLVNILSQTLESGTIGTSSA